MDTGDGGTLETSLREGESVVAVGEVLDGVGTFVCGGRGRRPMGGLVGDGDLSTGDNCSGRVGNCARDGAGGGVLCVKAKARGQKRTSATSLERLRRKWLFSMVCLRKDKRVRVNELGPQT